MRNNRITGELVSEQKYSKRVENMNFYNRHLSDITDTLRTFIGQNLEKSLREDKVYEIYKWIIYELANLTND
jgi:hypothetical protein